MTNKYDALHTLVETYLRLSKSLRQLGFCQAGVGWEDEWRRSSSKHSQTSNSHLEVTAGFRCEVCGSLSLYTSVYGCSHHYCDGAWYGGLALSLSSTKPPDNPMSMPPNYGVLPSPLDFSSVGWVSLNPLHRPRAVLAE